MVGLDLVELFDNSGMVDRKAAQLSERLRGFIITIGLNQVTRGFGEEEKTGIWLAIGMQLRNRQDRIPNDKNEGPQELHCHGDTVRSRVITILGCVVHNGC